MCKLCFKATPVCLEVFGVSTSTSNFSSNLRNAHDVNLTSRLSELSTKKTTSIISGKRSLIDNPNSSKHKFANARLLETCCKDLRPFNIVEQPGFIYEINKTNY
ncbi:hypothetical protein FF38_09316 [Lucilia cuprina]|uniref:Uncharacterized protein n=1 Tax=Lucilia cuprina TaxID=7375 RepID=A0A0L0BUB6_LUCCU|nr:hypothetical protein FF38_09316 [Lucilia cuprina]